MADAHIVDARTARQVAPAPAQPPLLSIMRNAFRQASGRVVLRVPVMAPHRRRVARALLQEGALAAGGVVMEGPDEDLLLIGAEWGRAERLRGLLDRLLGASTTQILSLERDTQALLEYAGSAQVQALAGGAPTMAGLDAWLQALPLAKLLSHQIGMGFEQADGRARPAFLRLVIERGMLARMLGPLGADADVLEHASRCLAGRLLQAIGDPAQGRALIGPGLPGPLHLAVPPVPGGGRGSSQAGGGGHLVATLGLEAASDPKLLLARRAGLAAQGWSLEIEGLDAAALRLLALDALPADWLRLAWSPALAAPWAMRALARIDPARLILAGVEDEAALAWGRRIGLRRMEGRAAAASVLPAQSLLPPVLPGVVTRIGPAPATRPAA
ncbi:MAG TPA: hypothetical protein VGN83_26980 [Falsiroseomonas sp.]|jgi:hypothetical protein|nr:hypothetical protein [Falsiroseomonas sp.]